MLASVVTVVGILAIGALLPTLLGGPSQAQVDDMRSQFLLAVAVTLVGPAIDLVSRRFLWVAGWIKDDRVILTRLHPAFVAALEPSDYRTRP